MSDEVIIEVVFALAEKQSLKTITVRRETTLLEAIEMSGVLDDYPQQAQSDLSFGVWGHVVAPDYRVKNGDRIEIYRPLLIEPRDARRKLAEVGRTMGKAKSD